MSRLLDPKTVSRVEALGIKARTTVEGLRVGDHKSPYRGFAVEFAEHREYVPGDDVRRIDWKSYGRSDRYTVKEYEQETNFNGHVLVDVSRSMLYGEGETNKLEYAKTLAAALCHQIIHQRDSAALHLFSAGWKKRLPPRSQLGHLVQIFETLETAVPEEKTAIGPLLHELAGELRRRGLVFLISDCFDDVEPILDGLRHLRFGGHDVAVLHVMHADELQFPFGGSVQFDGMEDEPSIRARPHLMKSAYQRAVEAFRGKLESGCIAMHCDYALMDTSRPLATALSEYLARRLRVRW